MPSFRFSVVALIVAFGCKSKDSGSAAAPATIETATFASSLNVDLKSMTKTASGLYYRDLGVGTGAVAEPGKQVAVKYAGQLIDGRQFDATGPNAPPLVFRPGRHDVIGGWDEGIPGMRVGGRRQLIIPPTLGYGAEGSGPIPPNAILVFTVEVMSVE